jgi:hypothetical protein
MNDNRCLYCNEIIPDGEKVCKSCERAEIKMGMILQSLNASEEEVKSAYDFMEGKR